MIQNTDLVPSERPSTPELQDAIQKGLGRALLWALQGQWHDESVLLNACLHDLRYDRQCEEARGPWLWQIMAARGVGERFRPILHTALQGITDGLEGQQLCELAVFYARDGDERFRRGLQEIVERKPDPTYPTLGEKQLIELDEEGGFLFAARVRGNSLTSREWDWEDRYFIEEGIAKLGESVALTALERESLSHSGLKKLYHGWHKSKREDTERQKVSHSDRMRQISLTAAIQIAESEGNQAAQLRGWGMYADEADLRIMRDRLLLAQEPAILANYLRAFSNHSIPEFNDRLLLLLDHPDDNVRARAFSAVAQNKHPAIRDFALAHLKSRVTEPNFLQLLIRNFESGDEALLSEFVRLPEDIDQRHWLLMDLRKILERNAEAICADLASGIYYWTPCGSCRHDVFKLMVERKVVPVWMIQECRHDAIEDTRILATTQVLE